jgi:orotate phosphoribosyltransferase
MHASAAPDLLAQEFVKFAVDTGALRFGEFKTKAGRLSPYFFNAGQFDDGAKLGRLAEFYVRRIATRGLKVGMLFGPAYKGIALATAIAVASARAGQNLPFAYNRKEVKDHGEGGSVVGAPVTGRVLIVDDMISAGTSVRESISIIEAAGAKAVGVAIALDRQERISGGGPDSDQSAVQFVTSRLQLQVAAIATLADLLQYLASNSDATLREHLPRVIAYRERYGVSSG